MSQLDLRTSPPAVPPRLVDRTRLHQRLSRGGRGTVTLVSAGPGFGKTLLVADWLASFRGRTAWLSLDRPDNDLRMFWADVLAALGAGDVLPPDSQIRELVPAATFGGPEILRIRAGLSELTAPAVLVLDDLDQVHSPGVLDSLSTFLEHQSSPLRVVLISRADPALRLHRLRVSGVLTEIRAEDLAFTRDESADLFRRHEIGVTDDQLGVLIDRTQGWPAGLRLAALSLTGSDVAERIATFSGTDRLVADYLLGEVLDRQSASYRDFLLRTSIVDRISPSLATVLTGRPDSESILETLVAANAFVVSLGDSGSWFRYHPLLRELMEHRLAVEEPEVSVKVHLLAAGWFAAHGDPIQAIRHATAALDWDEVGRLLTAFALPLVVTAAGPALAAALEPAANRAASDPSLATLLAGATVHFIRHDFDGMQRDARQAVEFLTNAPDETRIPAELLIAAVTLSSDRIRGSAELPQSSGRLIDLLESAPRRLVPAWPQYDVIGRNNLGVGELWAGRLEHAERQLAAVQQRATEYQMGLTVLSAQTYLSVLDVLHGAMRSAEARATEARHAADRRGWSSEPQVLGLYVGLGMTLLARDRLAEASDVIDAGLAASSRGSDTGCRLALGIAALGVALARNDAETAQTAADRLVFELDAVGDPPDLLARWCAVALAQARLTAGDPDEAIRGFATPNGEVGFAAALERLLLAKAQLAIGKPAAVSALVTPLTGPKSPYRAAAVEARVLLAIAADRQNRAAAALDLVSSAVDLAAPEGIIRPFLDNGLVGSALIARYRHVVARHLDFTATLTSRSDTSKQSSGPLVAERLTEREMIVLRYLPTMLNASEIAEDLYVSVNTVKSHLRSIYRKFDVTTRRTAVEHARELDLL